LGLRPDKRQIQEALSVIVLVTGGRHYADAERLDAELRALLVAGMRGLVHGACPTGADKLAKDWMRARIREQYAECAARRCQGEHTGRTPYLWMAGVRAFWEVYGRAAGPIRNGAMLKMFPGIALCLAFPGHSGTEDCCRQAAAVGIEVRRVA
jgi:hypothetical protein